MIKLAKLLKLADLFYTSAIKSLYSAEKLMSNAEPIDYSKGYQSPDTDTDTDTDYSGDAPAEYSDILDDLEGAWDKTIGGEDDDVLNFPKVLEQFIEVYKDYMDNPLGEGYLERAEAFNKVWSRLMQHPYLKYSVESDEWVEPYPPIKIINLLFAALKTANAKYAFDIEDPEATIDQISGVAEELHQAETKEIGGKKPIDPTAQLTGNVLQKMKEAHKRHRAARKAAGKLSLVELTKAIDRETDPAKKHSLEQQLGLYYSALKVKIWQAKDLAKIQSDPVRKAKYDADAANRQKKFHQELKQKAKLIDSLKSSTKASEYDLLINQLIEMERNTIQKMGYDLDDPFVSENPPVSDWLNPANIIKKYEERIGRVSAKRKTTGVNRMNKIITGEIEGLEIQIRRQLDDSTSYNKKKVAKKIRDLGMSVYNAPFFSDKKAKTEDAYKAAKLNPSAENIAAKNSAELEMFNSLEQYKNQLVDIENKKLLKLQEVVTEIHNIVGVSRGKTPKKLQDWFWLDPIPEEYKPTISDLILKTEEAIFLFKDNMKALCGTLQEIVSKLKEIIK